MKIKKGPSKNNRSRKLAILLGFILASILIHLLLVIVFFQHGFHKRAMSLLASLNQELTAEEQEQRAQEIQQKRNAVMAGLQALKHDKKDDRPAQLRAPKSNFGWVLFDEPPSKKSADPSLPMDIPTSMDGSVGEALLDQATEDEQEEPIQKVLRAQQIPLLHNQSLSLK